MVNKKGMCVDRTHLYHTLCKTPIKREKKKPVLIKKEIRLQIEQGRSIYKKKLKPPPEYDYYVGDHFIKEWFFKVEKSHLKNYIRIRS